MEHRLLRLRLDRLPDRAWHAPGILLNQKFPLRGLVRSFALIPWVIPGIVAATTWAWMFHTEFGIINYMLTSTGLADKPIGWLTNRTRSCRR